jgi:propanol-preferring alcohol dehydrogenase
MRAAILERPGPGSPLVLKELPTPEPGPGELRIKVLACAVCRTDLHILDGELHPPRFPLVPGHEVVGTVEALGPGVEDFHPGDRVGIPWLGYACGVCADCRRGQENLCRQAQFTGFTKSGGYATHALALAQFCVGLGTDEDPVHQAPLLCAGAIGYRCYRMAGDAQRLGLYGFGAAGHILAQLATFEGKTVFAFTRPGDVPAQQLALANGARWAQGSDTPPPEPLDAALLFAPVGALVPLALQAVRPGGAVICGGIHMSDIPSFPYALLWGERQLRSVANLTRRDARELVALAPKVPLRTTVTRFALEDANDSLEALRSGRLTGAAVLVPGSGLSR